MAVIPRSSRERSRGVLEPRVMAANARTRVLIADDHPLFRDGLARHIEQRPEFELVAEAGEGAEALRLIRELRPAVAVVDLKLPRMDGIRVTAAAAQDAPQTKVVILTAFLESAFVFKALAAGARAFLSKDADRADVCNAIIAVADGKVVIPPGLQPGLAEQIQARAGDDAPALSLREREVLALIADGASAPEIGRRLHLSTGTVKTHLQHLYEKLGVNDRAAAVAEAMRRGALQ
jgi:two-component system nitrate/nitrite response regulator NarL